jgi:acetyl/propionyl-CoA carboxylase alpha subunit
MGPWRQGGQGLNIRWLASGRQYDVEASRLAQAGGWRLTTGDASFAGIVEEPIPGIVVLREGATISRFSVARAGREVWVGQGGRAWVLERPAALNLERRSGTREGAGSQSVIAPMPGRVVRVEVTEGDAVSAHQVLVVMEAMKMEHALEAPSAGVVRRLACAPGDLVQAGASLVELGPAA